MTESRYFRRGRERSECLRKSAAIRASIEKFMHDIAWQQKMGFAVGRNTCCPVCSKSHRTYENLESCIRIAALRELNNPRD